MIREFIDGSNLCVNNGYGGAKEIVGHRQTGRSDERLKPPTGLRSQPCLAPVNLDRSNTSALRQSANLANAAFGSMP